DLLSLRNFLLEIRKDNAGLSMDLHGRLYILNNVLSADGKLRFDSAGLWGSLLVTTNGDWTFGPASFGAVFSVDVNLTSTPKTGYQGIMPAFSAVVLAKGNLRLGDAVSTGTFQFMASAGGVMIKADAMTKMGPLGTLNVKGDIRATSAGLVAKLFVAGNVSLGGLRINGETFFGINTTSTVSLGLDPNCYQFFSTGTFLLTDSIGIKGTFVIKIQPSRLSISADGTIEVPVIGKLQVIGGLNLDNYGVSGGISVVLSAGGVFGNGFSLTGRAQLLVNTGAIQQSISAFTVDRNTGRVVPSQTINIPARTISLDLGGELIVGGVFSVKGRFTGTINNSSMVLTADASMSLFNVTAYVNGVIGLYGNGMAASIRLTLPNFGVPGLFSISAGAFLQFNTRPGYDAATGLGGNFFSVGLRNCSFTILGFGFYLSEASLSVNNGVWKLNIPSPGLNINIGPLTFQFYGYLQSDGNFSLTSGFSFGVEWFPVFRVSLSGSATLSNRGFYASFSASAGGWYWGPSPWVWPWNWRWHGYSMGSMSGSLGIDGGGLYVSMFGRSFRFGGSQYSPPSGNWSP
ncbi:MAG: hypothetical protein ACKO5E_22665, partial [bacterium]